MSVNIRYPQITAQTDREQLAQVKSYLHQLVDQLNYALPTLGTGSGQTQAGTAAGTSSKTYQVQGDDLSYYELRSLIAQELDKVEVLIDEIEKKVESGAFNGKTPVKGVDYFTEEEVKAVAKDAAGKILFTLDADGNLYYEVEE